MSDSLRDRFERAINLAQPEGWTDDLEALVEEVAKTIEGSASGGRWIQRAPANDPHHTCMPPVVDLLPDGQPGDEWECNCRRRWTISDNNGRDEPVWYSRRA